MRGAGLFWSIHCIEGILQSVAGKAAALMHGQGGWLIEHQERGIFIEQSNIAIDIWLDDQRMAMQ